MGMNSLAASWVPFASFFSNEVTSGETGSTLRLPKLLELDPGCRPDFTPVCNWLTLAGEACFGALVVAFLGNSACCEASEKRATA
jgi:hypothetical protein